MLLPGTLLNMPLILGMLRISLRLNMFVLFLVVCTLALLVVLILLQLLLRLLLLLFLILLLLSVCCCCEYINVLITDRRSAERLITVAPLMPAPRSA